LFGLPISSRPAGHLEDEGHRREGLGVVDGGRLAVQAEAGRERRLEARLALLAFQRFQQRGFFAADVGAVTVVRVQLEAEAAAQDVVAQEAGGARFFQASSKRSYSSKISPWM
jgi:hypothetical protein